MLVLEFKVSYVAKKAAYLLVAHGSRDPRPQIGLERLAYLVQQYLQLETCPEQLTTLRQGGSSRLLVSPGPLRSRIEDRQLWVETASLELAPLPLHQRIQLQAEQVLARGIRRIRIVPLFLLPGVHVREDIPQQIAIARQNLGASTTIELCPHLGSHEQIINLLARQLTRLAAQKNIIVCHGSRRGEARQEMETMAKKLKAIAAYWAHGPSLEEQVRHLQAGGSQKIAILPYFLFRGGITDAITAQVHQLQNAYPQLELHLSNPLGATPELAQLIASTSLH